MLTLCLAGIVDAPAVAWLALRRGRARRGEWLLAVWNVLHIAAATTLCLLDGGIGSPLLAIFFLSIAFAATALPTRLTVPFCLEA